MTSGIALHSNSFGQWFAGMLLGAFIYMHPAQAVQQIKLQVATVDGNGWHAQQLELQLRLSEPLTAQINVRRANLEGVAEPVRNVVIDCVQLQLQAERFACPRAQIRGRFPYLGKQLMQATMRYGRRSGAIDLQLRNLLQLARGQAIFDAQLHAPLWQATLNLEHAEVAELLTLGRQFAPATLQDVNATGRIDATFTAQGKAMQPYDLKWQLQADRLTVSNAAGTLASETLALSVAGDAQTSHSQTTDEWQFKLAVAAPTGQAYIEPVFVDLTQHPLTVEAHGQFKVGDREIQLQQLEFQQRDVATLSAHGRLALNRTNPVPQLQLQVGQLQFPGGFASYVQPWLLNTNFKSLATAGTVQGNVVIKDSWPSAVDVTLNELSVDDGNKTFMFNGVNGALHWHAATNDLSDVTTTTPTSTLSWRSGTVLGVELGATQLQVEAWGSNFRLAQATRIPIFNGALAVDAFRVRKAGTPQMAFMLDANIEPINVAQLCRAFGWPEFGGELSGTITKLRLEQDVLTLGATLNAQVFAGDIAISNVKLEGALSQWPRFNADIKLNNLDLEQVTQAFSFGRITGRLSGAIDKLSLFNWEPITFDARLYTPADDRSKHRISQRAVETIGSIGGGSSGGVTAALQSGALRFFADFNYDKLGLSCRLVNEVCLMDGVGAAAKGGYYLVKGKGLPRIDVIGNATRVDWPRLLAQLKAATESGAPIVK